MRTSDVLKQVFCTRGDAVATTANGNKEKKFIKLRNIIHTVPGLDPALWRHGRAPLERAKQNESNVTPDGGDSQRVLLHNNKNR